MTNHHQQHPPLSTDDLPVPLCILCHCRATAHTRRVPHSPFRSHASVHLMTTTTDNHNQQVTSTGLTVTHRFHPETHNCVCFGARSAISVWPLYMPLNIISLSLSLIAVSSARRHIPAASIDVDPAERSTSYWTGLMTTTTTTAEAAAHDTEDAQNSSLFLTNMMKDASSGTLIRTVSHHLSVQQQQQQQPIDVRTDRRRRC